MWWKKFYYKIILGVRSIFLMVGKYLIVILNGWLKKIRLCCFVSGGFI